MCAQLELAGPCRSAPHGTSAGLPRRSVHGGPAPPAGGRRRPPTPPFSQTPLPPRQPAKSSSACSPFQVVSTECAVGSSQDQADRILCSELRTVYSVLRTPYLRLTTIIATGPGSLATVNMAKCMGNPGQGARLPRLRGSLRLCWG